MEDEADGLGAEGINILDLGQVFAVDESGIHVRSLQADRRSYEPFAAEEVGRRDHRVVIGKHSGSAAVHQVLTAAGIPVERREAEQLLPWIRTAAQRQRRWLTAREVVEVYQQRDCRCPVDAGQ